MQLHGDGRCLGKFSPVSLMRPTLYVCDICAHVGTTASQPVAVRHLASSLPAAASPYRLCLLASSTSAGPMIASARGNAQQQSLPMPTQAQTQRRSSGQKRRRSSCEPTSSSSTAAAAELGPAGTPRDAKRPAKAAPASEASSGYRGVTHHVRTNRYEVSRLAPGGQELPLALPPATSPKSAGQTPAMPRHGP